tara:strand:- start:75 stop:392 length:318 start_codon:yes stop_codon:yes gene_type:complete
MTQTADRRKDVAESGRYDIYIEIDVDCEELLDAIGLDYEPVSEDVMQNEVCLSLDKDEYDEFSFAIDFNTTDEQGIASYLLNHELGEYTTKVTIYKPSGDKVTFE